MCEIFEYKRIFQDNVRIQKQICERFQKNFENKQTIRNYLIPSDPMIGWSTVITRPVVTVMDNK